MTRREALPPAVMTCRRCGHRWDSYAQDGNTSRCRRCGHNHRVHRHDDGSPRTPGPGIAAREPPGPPAAGPVLTGTVLPRPSAALPASRPVAVTGVSPAAGPALADGVTPDGVVRCDACRADGVRGADGRWPPAVATAEIAVAPYRLALCRAHLAGLSQAAPAGAVHVCERHQGALARARALAAARPQLYVSPGPAVAAPVPRRRSWGAALLAAVAAMPAPDRAALTGPVGAAEDTGAA